MEGHDPNAPRNDKDQQPATLPLAKAKRARTRRQYHIAIPTRWTEAGRNLHLPEEDSPRYQHVGSRNTQASFELLYISSRGLTELADLLYQVLAQRTILPTLQTEAEGDMHPISLLELFIDPTWLLCEDAMEARHPTGIPVVRQQDLTAGGIVGLIEALNWEWHRRRYP